MFKTRLNNITVGALTGILLPFITALIVYYTQFRNNDTDNLLKYLKQMGILTKILSLCVVPNLLAFFLFIWTNRLLSARGVLLATFIVTVFVVVLKFIV